MLSVPPSRVAAVFVALNGVRTISSRRRSERSVHSGECAFSTSESCVTRPRIVPTVAVLAAGMAIGSASSSLTWRATPIGSRNPPAMRSRTGLGRAPRRWHDGLDGLAFDGRRIGRVAIEVEVLQRHLHPALTVGDRVVHLRDERRLAPAQALDDGELPQRTRPVERVERDQRPQVEQLAHRPRLGQRDAPHVDVDVEPGVVGPCRCGQVDRRRVDPPPQAWDVPGRPLHARPQAVEVGRTVEHRDRPERRREVGVLLQAPHQPLGIGHLALVAHRPILAQAPQSCPKSETSREVVVGLAPAQLVGEAA